MNIFKKFVAFLRFREAVKRADEEHQRIKRRYYVLPTLDEKLVIVDRKNFRELRRKHYIHRGVKVPDLIKQSLYHTPDAREMGGTPASLLKQRFKEYITWLEDHK